MGAPVIEVAGLRKRYGAVEAVRGIDLSVTEGEVFGLLGPNGAGKTTTVEILEGFRGRDGGEVRVLGLDPQSGGRALRERVGVVLQDSAIDRFLTVAETVALLGGAYPRPLAVDRALALVGLQKAADLRVGKLSGGQRRRLDMAVGLAGDPELLFLDEPTTGFDPAARQEAWSTVEELTRLGKTIVLTTHYLEEAQRLCDRVAIMRAGRIVADGEPRALIAGGVGSTRVRFGLPAQAGTPPLGEPQDDGRFAFETEDTTAALGRLLDWARDREIALQALEVLPPTLEEVYLELTRAEASS